MDFLVLANWKMQLGYSETIALAKETVRLCDHVSAGVRVGVFPSALYCAGVQEVCSGSAVDFGVQNISGYERGAYTGQISARSASEMQARYSLVGHMEVRKHHGDGDALCVEKAILCAQYGLRPVICFGGDEREPFVHACDLIESLRKNGFSQKIVLAFEPEASIGSGVVSDPQSVGELARSVCAKSTGDVALLYGGSVNADNVRAFFKAGVQGVLVGGASQELESWCGIFDKLKQLMDH